MNESMEDLDEIINNSRDAREVKRALCVKMVLSEMSTSQICDVLNVSQPFVSKWRSNYAAAGASSLLLSYQGSESYLHPSQREEVLSWISSQERITIEGLRDYIESSFGVLYQSKQSYYELMSAAGMSYHKSEKENPKRDEAEVLERREEIKKN